MSTITTIRAISSHLYEGRYHQAEIRIGGNYFHNLYIRIPCNTSRSMITLLKSRGLELRFVGFIEPYNETVEELNLVIDNLRLGRSTPVISTRFPITYHYLALLGIQYTFYSFVNVRMQEVPLLFRYGFGDQLLEYFMEKNLYEHVRILLESGYVPSPEFMESLFNKLEFGHMSIILITLPLPWTDEMYYQLAHKIFMIDPEDGQFCMDMYQYFIFYDSAYQPFWDGLKRYIQANPNCDSIHQIVLNFIENNVIDQYVQHFNNIYSSNDGYMITDYNILIFRDPSKYKNPFRRFCRLIRRSPHHIYDPRLFHYWRELCEPENREILRKSMVDNPSIVEYLEYKKLYSPDDSEVNSDLRRLVTGVMSGEFHHSQLPEGNPIRELLKCRNTKSSKKSLKHASVANR
jgi:hypothetical protein